LAPSSSLPPFPQLLIGFFVSIGKISFHFDFIFFFGGIFTF
jgi:hypothetical protein